jgi:hypothetical protein
MFVIGVNYLHDCRQLVGMPVSEDISAEDIDYFEEMSDGCGCTEVWEYMSDKRSDD